MSDTGDRTSTIFGNSISSSAYKKAVKQKSKFEKKFKHDPDASYSLKTEKNPVIGPPLGVENIVVSESGKDVSADNAVALGTIRMGFGHYRIAMAAASAAHSMGITPYWFDLLSFDTTGRQIIHHLEKLYNLGSRLSQKFSLFNKFYWEPLTAEGFKKLDFNASDQKTAELMADIYGDLPKELPFVATHAWASQAAVHAGMKRVVNMIPDNWPLGLHLSEGAVHTIQSPSAYMGYRTLKHMDKKRDVLSPMPSSSIEYTGHYIDHELVHNIEKDCQARLKRIQGKKTRRVLLSIGGAGAQQDIFLSIIRYLLPLVKDGSVTLFLNMGDHGDVWKIIEKELKGYEAEVTTHFDWDDTKRFASRALRENVTGLHAFLNDDIFAAIYATNLLIRAADVLITKPSELAYYPVPKLFIQRVGGHEAWGAIRGAELGEGTIECETIPLTIQALDLMLNDNDLLTMYCENIIKQKSIGTYDGAYRVIELAMDRKQKGKKRKTTKKK